MFKFIKDAEPSMNKKAKTWEPQSVEARLETRSIAKQFEEIFCQEDALPTNEETLEMYKEVEELKKVRKENQIPPLQ